jgi:dTMP kinase
MKYHVEFDVDLRRNPYKGLYIALEGIDGGGKTTQLMRLKNYFEKEGKEVIATREPRKQDGVIGDLIQKILNGNTEIPAVAFQYLFTADREVHHAEVVLPALEEGKVVITDRCFWSAIPYGLLDRKSDVDDNIGYMLAAQGVLSMYHQFVVPNYTFYLDISLDVAMDRIISSGEGGEIYEEKGKLEKVKSGYEWLLKEFPKEFVRIDGMKSVAEVTDLIIDNL